MADHARQSVQVRLEKVRSGPHAGEHDETGEALRHLLDQIGPAAAARQPARPASPAGKSPISTGCIPWFRRFCRNCPNPVRSTSRGASVSRRSPRGLISSMMVCNGSIGFSTNSASVQIRTRALVWGERRMFRKPPRSSAAAPPSCRISPKFRFARNSGTAQAPETTEICAFASVGGEPADVLLIGGAELKALPLAPRVPDQAGQEGLRIVVAQAAHCRSARHCRPFRHRRIRTRFGRKEMAVHPRAGHLAQPGLEIVEDVGKALKDGIGRAGLAIFPAARRESGSACKAPAAPSVRRSTALENSRSILPGFGSAIVGAPGSPFRNAP